MAVLNYADRIYLNGQEVDSVYLDGVQVYSKINLYQLFKDRVLADNGTFIENPIVFNKEKLLLTPNAYKENKLYSALPSDGSGDFTFSRNSSATYIEDGVIKTALPNVPRIQDGKILIEGQATNLINNSNIFNKTNNERFRVTGNIPNEYAPFDSTLCETLVSGYNHVSLSSFTVKSGALFNDNQDHNYSISLIIEKGTQGDFIRMQTTFINISFHFQFSTGELTPGSMIISHKVTEITEGVFLIEIITEIITPSSSINSSLRAGNVSNNITAISEIGDFKISYFGYQIDTDDSIGIIPTNGEAVTRLADIATVTPPTGVTSIIETIDGVEQAPITTIPPTYQLPEGLIDNVKMI